MNDRQHYVFLDVSDSSEERTMIGDEAFVDYDWVDVNPNVLARNFWSVRRPVPTAQPTETCKWKRQNCCIQNPHTLEWTCDAHKDCPTCGKKIEVTE